jgi:hypothetical protein
MAKVTKQKKVTEELVITLVGLQYRMDMRERKILKHAVDTEGGIECKFVLEPDNEVDPKAVKVLGVDVDQYRYTNQHLGYVQRPVNEKLFDAISGGVRVLSCFLTWVDAETGEGELTVELA